MEEALKLSSDRLLDDDDDDAMSKFQRNLMLPSSGQSNCIHVFEAASSG